MNVLQLPLMLAPLAVYLYILGVLHASGKPKAISGGFDFAFLAIAIWAILEFGPVGSVLSGPWLGPARGRLIAGLLLVIVASALSGGANPLARIIVYNITPLAMDVALARALARIPFEFRPTLRGYEDARKGLTLVVEAGGRFRVASISAQGPRAVELVRTLKPLLTEELRLEDSTDEARTAWGFFIASSLTMIIPFAIMMLVRPDTRDVIRLLWKKIQGG